MRSMVQGWSHQHLSHGGRLALIRITLATLPFYYLQVMQPTTEAFNELEQIMAIFFWGSRVVNRSAIGLCGTNCVFRWKRVELGFDGCGICLLHTI
ncbi:hypothetical protein ACS0TY_004690 [Phlomoides rotata]